MRKKLFLEGLVLILIFGAVWVVFAVFPILPHKSVFQISKENETKLGDLLTRNILRTPEFNRVSNDTIAGAMDQVTKRLLSALDSSEYKYKITVFNNDMANAFALPGGNILVSTGLISLTVSAEEMAAVMAHEMGHIEKRHTLSLLLKNFTLTVLFSDDALVSEATSMLLSTAFDRKHEEEADRFGLQLLEKACVNPRFMGTVFRHLKEESGAYNPDMEILMSHPDMDSRIKAAYDYKVAGGFKEEPIRCNWEAARQHVTPLKSQ